MSVFKDTIMAVRETLKLGDDVRRAGELLKSLSLESRDHDRRITRLEAKWDTAIELSRSRSGLIGRD
jgi:hypothetical protein